MMGIYSVLCLALLIWYVVCLLLVCIPAFCHTPGNFPGRWFPLIGVLFWVRFTHFQMYGLREFGDAVARILFREWVNGIDRNESTPIIDENDPHTGLNVNMSPRDTVIMLVICLAFILAGGVKYSNKNLRWMIAVSATGIGEVFVRLGLEICLPRFWEPTSRPEYHLLRREFLRPSFVTRHLFGALRFQRRP